MGTTLNKPSIPATVDGSSTSTAVVASVGPSAGRNGGDLAVVERIASGAPGARGTSARSGGPPESWLSFLFRIGAREVLAAGVAVAAVAAVAYIVDPSRPERQRAQAAKRAWSARLTQAGRGHAEFTHHESMMLADLVDPKSLREGFADVGGLADVVTELRDLVVLPLQRPDLFANSRLTVQPTGILLYGPPGTGKTLLAKAIAAESGAFFLNLNTATVMNKFVGESQKLVQAVFSLAEKLAPTVVFIDEIDGLLGVRTAQDHDFTAQVKTQFMAQWDGLTTGRHSSVRGGGGVLVVGASNRPWMIDPAVLRRMPRTFYVGLPSVDSRRDILRVLLRHERVASDFDYDSVARATEGYSGSDLKDLCRAAAMRSLKEFVRREESMARAAAPASDGDGAAAGGAGGAGGGHDAHVGERQPRPMVTADFLACMGKHAPSGHAAEAYRSKGGAAFSGLEGAGMRSFVDMRGIPSATDAQSWPWPEGAAPHAPEAPPLPSSASSSEAPEAPSAHTAEAEAPVSGTPGSGGRAREMARRFRAVTARLAPGPSSRGHAAPGAPAPPPPPATSVAGGRGRGRGVRGRGRGRAHVRAGRGAAMVAGTKGAVASTTVTASPMGHTPVLGPPRGSAAGRPGRRRGAHRRRSLSGDGSDSGASRPSVSPVRRDGPGAATAM